MAAAVSPRGASVSEGAAPAPGTRLALDLDALEVPTEQSGLVFVLTGPSGVGKSTIIEHLKKDGFPISYCVTVTTRPPRDDEVDGVHYYFVSREQFQRLLDENRLVEHALVHRENLYGIPRFSMRRALITGNDLIMPPEIQGAQTICEQFPRAITIFLRPTSLDELVESISRRPGTDPREVAIRMETAREEMAHMDRYRYIVENRRGELDRAVSDLKSIITAERLRRKRRTVTV